jgi:hypothetical protein
MSILKEESKKFLTSLIESVNKIEKDVGSISIPEYEIRWKAVDCLELINVLSDSQTEERIREITEIIKTKLTNK